MHAPQRNESELVSHLDMFTNIIPREYHGTGSQKGRERRTCAAVRPVLAMNGAGAAVPLRRLEISTWRWTGHLTLRLDSTIRNGIVKACGFARRHCLHELVESLRATILLHTLGDFGRTRLRQPHPVPEPVWHHDGNVGAQSCRGGGPRESAGGHQRCSHQRHSSHGGQQPSDGKV